MIAISQEDLDDSTPRDDIEEPPTIVEMPIIETVTQL